MHACRNYAEWKCDKLFMERFQTTSQNDDSYVQVLDPFTDSALQTSVSCGLVHTKMKMEAPGRPALPSCPLGGVFSLIHLPPTP